MYRRSWPRRSGSVIADIRSSGPNPTALDPRVLVMVPRQDRAAVSALWQLEARLFDVVASSSEPMLAQIKLAWWRDRLAQVAQDPAGLPKGEPLLALLAANWQGRISLASLVDGYEAILLAQDSNALVTAGHQLGTAMCAVMLNGADQPMEPGRLWGLMRAGQLAHDPAGHRAMLERIGQGRAALRGPRVLRTLDRWALLMARHGGVATPRAEGWLLLRAGLGL